MKPKAKRGGKAESDWLVGARAKAEGLSQLQSGARASGPDEQLAEIVKDIAAGRWQSGKSHRAKAKKWGVSLALVNVRATEAARFIRLTIGNSKEDIAAMLVANVEAIGRAAVVGTQEHWSETAGVVKLRKPNYSAGLGAIELKAKLLRLVEPQRVVGAPADWSTLTPSQRAERIAEGRRYLDELEAQERASNATNAGASE